MSLGVILKYMKSRFFLKSIQILALLSVSTFWVCCSDDNSSNANENKYVESSSSDAGIEVPESSSSTSFAEDTLNTTVALGLAGLPASKSSRRKNGFENTILSPSMKRIGTFTN